MKNYCGYCMSELENDGSCKVCNNSNYTVAPHHLRPGTLLWGKYVVGRALGEGGFGITYIGRDITLDIKVAIKEYFPNGYVNRNSGVSSELIATTEKQMDFFNKGKERFLFEARSIAKFNKEKSIVDVRDYFEENGTAYIIMEYLDGENLSVHIRKNGTDNPAVLFEKMVPIMDSLDKMHAAGIIHRDISPDNIMVMNDGTLKLMDFGSARYFANEEKMMSIMLKQGYAPEEQYRQNGDQGPWTDVYGLCATVYRCITGRVPVNALDRIYKDDLKKPSQLGIVIDSGLEKILMYGLAVFKNNRCKSMSELKALTEKALLHAKNNTDSTSPVYGYAVDVNYRQQQRQRYDNTYGDNFTYYNQNTSESYTAQLAKKKDNGMLVIIICIVAFFVIAGFVLLGVLLYPTIFGKSDPKVEETTVVAAEAPTQAPTVKPTEKPKQEATKPPVENKKVPDEALYAAYIEDALNKSYTNSSYARGYLCDLNSDGTKELIMVYDTDGGARCVTSVYTVDSKKVAALLYEKELCYNASGSFGGVSIVDEDGQILVCANGEQSEGNGYYYGFWDMYSFDGYSLNHEYDSGYEYRMSGSNVDYNSSTAQINGATKTYKEYKEWLDTDFALIAYLSYEYAGEADYDGSYESSDTALSLTDLYSYIISIG